MDIRAREYVLKLWNRVPRASSLFKRRSSRIGVVEIGREYAKLGILNSAGPGYHIARIDTLRLRGQDHDSPIRDLLASEEYARNLDCILVLPQEFVSSRRLTMPNANPQDIDRMVCIQARVCTPFPEDDFVYGYHASSTNQDGSLNIILYTAQRTVVRRGIDLIESCGHRVTEVVPSAELIRISHSDRVGQGALPSDRPVAVVDLDFSGVCILAYDSGHLVQVRALPTVIDRTTASEEIDGQPHWCVSVASEISSTLASYVSPDSENKLESVILSGASELTSTLSETLKVSHPDLSFVLEDPLASSELAVTDSLRALSREHSIKAMLGLTSGSRTDRSNMLPDELKRKIRTTAFRRYASITVILILANLSLLLAYFRAEISEKETYYAQLQTEISKTSEAAEELRRLRQEMVITEQRAGSNSTALDALRDFYVNAPNNIRIELFEYTDSERSSVVGTADKLSDVLSYVSRLRTSDVFSEVNMDYANNNERLGVKRMQFRISAKMGR